MKHVLLLITTFLTIVFSSSAQHQTKTIRSEMKTIHEHFGINFIYDSSLEIDVPYNGKPMDEMAKAHKNSSDAGLEQCLQTLFKDSGIDYEVMKKYIVLTKAGSKKKPRDYTILIEEQFDTINESVVTALVDPQRNTTQTGLKRIDSKDLNSGFALFSTLTSSRRSSFCPEFRQALSFFPVSMYMVVTEATIFSCLTVCRSIQ